MNDKEKPPQGPPSKKPTDKVISMEDFRRSAREAKKPSSPEHHQPGPSSFGPQEKLEKVSKISRKIAELIDEEKVSEEGATAKEKITLIMQLLSEKPQEETKQIITRRRQNYLEKLEGASKEKLVQLFREASLDEIKQDYLFYSVAYDSLWKIVEEEIEN